MEGQILVVEPRVDLKTFLGTVIARNKRYFVKTTSFAHSAERVIDGQRQELSLIVVGWARLSGRDCQTIVDMAKKFGIPILILAYPVDPVPTGFPVLNAWENSEDKVLEIVRETIAQGKE